MELGFIGLLAHLYRTMLGTGREGLDHLAKGEMDVHCGGASLLRLSLVVWSAVGGLGAFCPKMDELRTRAPIGGAEVSS